MTEDSDVGDVNSVNPKVDRKPRLRKLWLSVHRWLGLTVGLMFVLIGLTGSLLVFDHAIDEWLNPDLLLTEESGERASLNDVIAVAEQAYSGKAVSVSKPRVDLGVWTVWFSSDTEKTPSFTAVYVDPYTTRVTGRRVWGQDLMSWIYRLHFRLVAGDIGATIVGIIGIMMMISIVSGIYLWWPLWKKSWRAAFAIRSGRRVNFDLHKSLGIFSAIFLLVIAFTGVYMEFHEWFHETVALFAEVGEHPSGLTSMTTSAKEPLTSEEALALAQTHFPHALFDHLHPPIGQDGFYEVAFRQPGEVQQSFGRTQVFLNQYTGDILAIRTPQDFTAADAFFAWQFPLHNGEAFGLIGRWFVLVMGLVPSVLYVTGFLLWRRRRKPRASFQKGEETSLPSQHDPEFFPEKPELLEHAAAKNEIE